MTTQSNVLSSAINRSQRGMVSALGISALLFLYLFLSSGWRQALLFAVGLSAGVILYHAAFGFTAAWRNVVTTGRSAGLRAQMIMLGLTVLCFVPLLSQGEFAGTNLRGSVAPLSVAVIAGAFIFGLGMQLGGGCASGTLFTAGGGNARMLVTLTFFVVGSVIGSWHWGAWQQVPSFGTFSLLENYGAIPAIVISLSMFAGIWFLAAAYEERRHGKLEAQKSDVQFSLITGPWPLLAGGLALAAVNVSTLILAGRPWGVTSAFALWGAKIGSVVGLDVSSWVYWQTPARVLSLENSVLADTTSVMNFGIILGALLAAGLAQKFSPSFNIPRRSLAAAIIGGIMLGYGARIAYGCNIGAYFSGISSTSLHGWLWFVAAFIGSTLGTKMRPWFGLN